MEKKPKPELKGASGGNRQNILTKNGFIRRGGRDKGTDTERERWLADFEGGR